MDAAIVGAFIAQQRKKLKLTQADLAERLHVTDKAVSRWERGVGLPDINLLEPLANALEVSLVELVKAQVIENATISIQDADSLVSDTIQLSSPVRPVRMLGALSLTFFGITIFFLLWILITDGNAVIYSVGSLVLGLIAWMIPICGITLLRTKMNPLLVLLSMFSALASVSIQFFYLSYKVDVGDFAAIEDTIGALCFVVVLFSAAALVLNLLMILRI